MSTSLMMRGSKAREVENLLVPALRNCTNSKGLKRVHANIVKLSLTQSSFLITKMVEVCDNLGEVNYAVSLFEQVADRNVFLYNAVIRAHARNHSYGLAVALYKQMLRERHVSLNEFTLPFVLKSCAGLVCDSLGRQVHAQAIKFGLKSHYMIDNGLMDVYVKCGHLTEAHKLFDEMRVRDLVCWNNLISGYARVGQMRKARAVFEGMPEKSIVSWTAMISGYAGIGRFSEALEVFREMQGLGVEPDEISVVSVLPACAQLGALEIGKWIHFYSDKKGLSRSTSVCNALIEMYAKCGCIDQAVQLFDRMAPRDVISWSTMIASLANHGKAHEAIAVFQDMQRSRVVKPNWVTFLGLLSACVHAGLWREGLEYFESMKNDHHLEPQVEHYGCLVDLLGRSGLLHQALETIEEMSMKPDSKIWCSLLNSSRVHCNLEIALVAMEHLLELEPDDVGNYVLLSNIYADVGRWDQVAKIRKVIRSRSVKKIPGSSSIEINSAVEEFISGDNSKSYANDLFSMLDLLVSNQNLLTKDLREIMSEEHAVLHAISKEAVLTFH